MCACCMCTAPTPECDPSAKVLLALWILLGSMVLLPRTWVALQFVLVIKGVVAAMAAIVCDAGVRCAPSAARNTPLSSP